MLAFRMAILSKISFFFSAFNLCLPWCLRLVFFAPFVINLNKHLHLKYVVDLVYSIYIRNHAHEQ